MQTADISIRTLDLPAYVRMRYLSHLTCPNDAFDSESPLPLPSELTINRRFMLAFLAAEAPCFTLGLVEQGGRPCALIGLRLDRVIPVRVLPENFSFGHSMRAASDGDVVHFGFKFHEVATYNGLINPGSFVARAVLSTMVETGDTFFLVLDSGGNRSAFRQEIGMGNLAGLRANMPRIQRSAASQAQYRLAVAQFLERPEPPGTLLDWVCQEQHYAIDLVRDRVILAPAQILKGTAGAP